ncbi:unnamed protein product [Phytophthora fragariaefolia]|uniref:Unnamed protein product n=1 Tax=Phytophthora fragariaefolia TaxID=1490495 RepID=A0A9W6XWG8_9STRA|nr:unnamed protein product [Phytophthora fragariaefolia]
MGYPLAGGAVMNVTERRSVKDPYRFAGIKWWAAKSVWGLMRDRDVLTYERMGVTVDADGEQWGYHTLQSTRRPEWPMEATPGMQRQHTATCYLYRPRRDINKTEIFMWGSIYKFGKYPDKVIYYGVATTWLNVVHCPKGGHAKKFSALMERADSHGWTPSSGIESEPEFLTTQTRSTITGSESASTGRSDSLIGDEQPADPFRPRISSSPTASFPVLGADRPLDRQSQLVLDW